MSGAPRPLAGDGKPKVDVIALAGCLLMPGSGLREATMVSTRETIAMAEAITVFHEIGTEAASLTKQVAALDGMPAGPVKRKALGAATETFERIEKLLAALGYPTEEGHVDAH